MALVLAESEAQAETHGGQPLHLRAKMVRGGIETWALLAAGLLAAAVLGAPLLGIAGWQPVAMGAAVALGLLYVVCRALALEPLLRHSTAARPPLVFLLLPFGFYLALIPWSIQARAPDGDEPWFLLATHSIAHDFDLDLANNYRGQDSLSFMPRAIEPQPGDPETPDGAIHSRHGALLQTVMAPAYRFGGRAGAMIVIAALAALAAWFVLGLTAFSRDARARLTAYLAFGFGAPFLIYSQQVWAEAAAVLLAVAAYRWVMALTGSMTGHAPGEAIQRFKPPLRTWLFLAAALALLPALKLRLVLVSAALLAICVFRLPPALRWRVAVSLLAVLAPAGALVLWLNRSRFGSVLGMHSWSELAFDREAAVASAFGLNGLFFDLAYGLVACAPIWLLLFPAAVVCWQRNRRLLFEVAAIAAPTLLLASTRSEWYGGWSPPFRYGLVTLPFLALLLVPLFERRSAAEGGARAAEGGVPAGVPALAAVLALLTGGLAVLYVVEPGWTYNLADGRHHLIHHLEHRAGLDFARFLPSATRPRMATWLVPAAAIGFALLACRARRRTIATAVAGVPMLAIAILPALAEAAPTWRIELESAAVRRSGGNLDPQRWTMDRTRYREAWVLGEGDRAEARVVAGGDEVELAVTARVVRNRPAPIALIARAGDREIGRFAFPDPRSGNEAGWQTRKLPAAPWPKGAPLVLEVAHAPGEALPPNGVAIDRVDLRWR